MWDGRNSSGNPVADGAYTVRVTFNPGGSFTYPAKLVAGPDQCEGVFIVGKTEHDTQVIIDNYCSRIRASMERRKSMFPNYKYVVIPTVNDGKVYGNFGTRMRKKLREWFGTTLRDFYWYGHGSPATLDIGGMTFHSATSPRGKRILWPDQVNPLLNLSPYFALGNASVNSVYLDACNTATSSYSWLNAFLMNGIPEECCFVGMGGLNGALTATNSFGTFESIWYDYNVRYLDYVAAGYYRSQAIALAISNCGGMDNGFSPKTPGLIQRYGDAQIPRY